MLFTSTKLTSVTKNLVRLNLVSGPHHQKNLVLALPKEYCTEQFIDCCSTIRAVIPLHIHKNVSSTCSSAFRDRKSAEP